MTKIASPNPTQPNSTGSTENPYSLSDAIAKAEPGEDILLRGGDYAGIYHLKTVGVSLQPYENEPARLTGPAKYIAGQKPAWLTIYASAKGAAVTDLSFEREGNIADLFATGWSDFGIAIEAPYASVTACRLRGMNKGIQIRGKTSTGVTLNHNHIGPTIQSNIVVATSYGVVRGGLIMANLLEGSYREDGIQFMQDFDSPDQTTDVSNLGMIVYRNTIRDQSENAIDLKGAGLVVIDGNMITRIMGSNDGLAYGGNRNSFGSIMRGAKTSTRRVIARNNVIYNAACGISLYDEFKAYNNVVLWNRFDYTGPGSSTGNIKQDPKYPIFYGLKAAGAPIEAKARNNLVGLHELDFQGLSDAGNQVVASPDELGDLYAQLTGDLDWGAFVGLGRPGFPLTTTTGTGESDRVPVVGAMYFTDWFGRAGLHEVVCIAGQQAEVIGVDTNAHQLQLDRVVRWAGGEPVCWQSPHPKMGLQLPYTPPPPPVETVRLILEADMTPDEATQLRALLWGKQVRVSLG